MSNILFPTSTAQKVSNIWNNDYALCDEGAKFVALNPTSGTAIATTTSVVDDAATASATHAQNVPVMYIQNGWSASDPLAKTIYLRYLRMIVGQVPTSATDWQMSIRADNNSAGYTSGGTLITPVNANTGSSALSKAVIYFGAVVTPVPLAASARLLARAQINSAVPVTKDQWMITFGEPDVGMCLISGGAGAKNVSLPIGAIAIAPGWNIRIGMWGTSNAAAPSFEFELGYVERVAGQ